MAVVTHHQQQAPEKQTQQLLSLHLSTSFLPVRFVHSFLWWHILYSYSLRLVSIMMDCCAEKKHISTWTLLQPSLVLDCIPAASQAFAERWLEGCSKNHVD